MPPLLHSGVIFTGPAIVIDAAGRRTRNAAVQPCGCRVEDIYIVSDLAPSAAMPGGAHREGWVRVASACDCHAAVVAVRMLRASEEKRYGGKPLPAAGPHRHFLDNGDKILAAGAALDGELRARGFDPAGIERALALAEAAAAGALLPEGAVSDTIEGRAPPAPALPPAAPKRRLAAGDGRRPKGGE